MTNLKKYNIFITITSFAKLLVEIFIPLLLYTKGFTIKEITLFLLIKYLFCTLFTPLTLYLGRKYKFTKLMFISSILFSITYIYINFLKRNVLSLIILGIIYALYLSFYWIGRHIYALTIIEDKKITDNTTLYQIFTTLGGLFGTFLGAKILNHMGYKILTIIILFLMTLSIIPLIKIDTKTNTIKTKLKTIIQTYPKRNYLFTVVDQLKYTGLSVLPLYIYLNIKKEFNYLGIVNIICGIGSIIYIYFISKKMDKNKKDYLKLSLILYIVILTLKITITDPKLFLILTFPDGIIKASLDTIILRNTYAYGKNYSPDIYICFIEFISNLTRTILFILIYITNISLKQIIIISIIGTLLNTLIGFDDGKYGYKKDTLTNVS